MPAFSEMSALTSRKDVTERGMNVPVLSETLKLPWLHSSAFFRKKSSKMLNFQVFTPLKQYLVASFSQKSALNSRKYIAKQFMNVT